MYRTKRKKLGIKTPKGMHAHHIIPLHAGGSNDISNIAFLSIEEHAEAHRMLFEQHGRWQDKIAWQMLSGMIGKEEAINIAQKNSDKSWMKTPEGRNLMKQAHKRSREAGNRPDPWNKGLTKEQDLRLQDASKRASLHMKQGRIHCIGDHHRGKNFSDSHKNNLSDSAKNRSKVLCMYCSKEITPQMYSRWHGDKCKSRRG